VCRWWAKKPCFVDSYDNNAEMSGQCLKPDFHNVIGL
jgi:hypothetical protein